MSAIALGMQAIGDGGEKASGSSEKGETWNSLDEETHEKTDIQLCRQQRWCKSHCSFAEVAETCKKGSAGRTVSEQLNVFRSFHIEQLKLLVTSASLLVTSALLVVTRNY